MLLPSPILFICDGNLCRSPFAARYFQQRLDDTGLFAECFSRGLIAMPGQHVPDTALKVAAEFGVDLSAHLSQPLLSSDIERAAMILGMEQRHRSRVVKMQPTAVGKTFIITEHGDEREIADPVGRDEAFYRGTYDQIVSASELWLGRFGATAALDA